MPCRPEPNLYLYAQLVELDGLVAEAEALLAARSLKISEPRPSLEEAQHGAPPERYERIYTAKATEQTRYLCEAVRILGAKKLSEPLSSWWLRHEAYDRSQRR